VRTGAADAVWLRRAGPSRQAMLSVKSQRLIAAVLVASSMALLALSNYRYGLEAQSGIVASIVPLLFAGLLLGRVGVWTTMACYLPILLLGAGTDIRGGTDHAQMWRDAVSNLMQPLLGSLIIALILDRLIAKLAIGNRRNRDLTALVERLEVEIREREQSQMQLVHSQRVDALGKLASNVAHDFNNILGIVLGYVGRAEHVAGDNNDVRQNLDKLRAATQRGQRLTSKLLSLARSDDYAMERFDINEAINALEPLLHPLFAPGIAVRIECATAPAPVSMDRAGFEAVLLNMAKNASDAFSERGEFQLSTAIENGYVRILVADTGSGMTPEVAVRAFEPFFSAKPRGQGTGIGLAVAYRVVTEAGGNISVETAPGKGARFTIRLPLAST
jgi:signal transduction histidine kinase